MLPKLSVIVPAYNERATIEDLLSRVRAVDIDKEIIIVDDGSTDGTREFLMGLINCPAVARGSEASGTVNMPVSVFFQEKCCGKGAAIHRGLHEARGAIVIIQDADLELDPRDYFRLVGPIESGITNIVYGSRFLGNSRLEQALTFYLANKFLTGLSNFLTGLKLTDVWTGYKVFRREVLLKFALREKRFGFEPEITAKVARCGYKIVEVPVSYVPRRRSDGKKIRWKDGLLGLWCTVRYNLWAIDKH